MGQSTQTTDQDKLQAMLKFEKVCKFLPKEVYVGQDYNLFVVPDGMKNKAIGHQGANIKRLKNDFANKMIIVTEFFEDPYVMLNSYYDDIKILMIKERHGKYLVYVPDEERGKAIGKNGYKIKALRELFRTKFGKDVGIMAISVIEPNPPQKTISSRELSEVAEISLSHESDVVQSSEEKTQRP